MSDFLDATDQLLRQGAASLSRAFCDSQIRFVLTQQIDSGGFRGSQGPADLYYTDFAVRCLVLMDAPDEPLRQAATWVTHQAPHDIIHWFCALNAQRLLASRGIACAGPGGIPPAGRNDHVYELFLGLLTQQMRGQLRADGVAESLSGLCRPDGGFAESPDGQSGQTNATAAALASLWIAGHGDDAATSGGLRFLSARQSADGGFTAHAGIDQADLLSTFTALLCLTTLGQLDVDLGGVARFVRYCARPAGGFAACGDPAAPVDVEYTYYGLATTCLLRYCSSVLADDSGVHQING